MAHPFAQEAMTGQERANARYSEDYGKYKSQDDAGQKPVEEWTAAPARQISNLGNVRK